MNTDKCNETSSETSTARMSLSESELKALPFCKANCVRLLDHLGDLPEDYQYPFIWRIGMTYEQFVSTVQEDWHFRCSFRASDGAVLVYKNSPVSSAHEIPNSVIDQGICGLNFQLTGTVGSPIIGLGACSIVSEVNPGVFDVDIVDGSWYVYERTNSVPNVVMEHCYKTDLVPTHTKLIKILRQNVNIRCGIIMNSYKHRNGSYSFVIYSIRKRINNALFVSHVISFGEIQPTRNTLNFIRTLNAESYFGIGLSENPINCNGFNLPSYAFTVASVDLLADAPTNVNYNANNINCLVDLYSIRRNIMCMNNANAVYC